MLGDTITITINAVAKALSKINQDQYASEYYLKETGKEFRLRVKHSKDKVAAGQEPRDRHVITLTETIFATPTANAIFRQSSFSVVGNASDEVVAQEKDASGLMAFLTPANTQKLINWES